jgi:hypothetical protein
MASCLDTPLMAGLIEYLTLRLTLLLSHMNMTLDETTCPRDVFECAGDKEMEENIFIDEELQGFDDDEDEPLHPSTSSPEFVPASTLEVEAPQATTSSTAAIETSQVEGEIISEQGAPSCSEDTSTSTNHR